MNDIGVGPMVLMTFQMKEILPGTGLCVPQGMEKVQTYLQQYCPFALLCDVPFNEGSWFVPAAFKL